MKGLAIAVSALLVCSARAAAAPAQAGSGFDQPASISDGNAKGFSTGGAGVGPGQTGGDVPDAIKIMLTEEQKANIRQGRDHGHLPPDARKALDSLLKSPNASAFERQMEQGAVNYSRPSGFDGARSMNAIGKSSLERSIPSAQAQGRDFQSSQGRRNPVHRQELREPRNTRMAAPRDLSESMSPLEAGSRRAMGRAGGGGGFSSLRDRPARFDPNPALFATEQQRAYREAERRARKRLETGRSRDAYSALAQSQIGLGNYKEARAAADRALQVNPNDADALALRAIASEGLGDEAAKMASLEEAARINPRRFSKLLQQVRDGQTLFDPSAADSWGLLGALAEAPEKPFEFPAKRAAWTLLALLIVGVPLAAGLAAYRRLSPDARRDAFAWWNKRFRGRAVPKLTVPVRRPDGPSIVKLEPGLRVADKYKLVRRIGADGTVQVWKALDKVLDRPVLMKQLYERRTDAGEWELRLSEAKKAATLHHPNIVDLYEILDMPIGLFVVYEYPSGKTLRDVINEVGSLPLLQALDILIPVCRGLQHAHHRGVVHGALSPERIVLTRQGYVKVTDFVLARTTGSDAGACVAPEAKRGEPTRASDIYSLGACLYEMLTGKNPGEPGDDEPDDRAESLLSRALDLDSRTRIQSARVFQHELEELRLLLKKDPSGPASRPPDPDPDSDQADRGTRNDAAA